MAGPAVTSLLQGRRRHHTLPGPWLADAAAAAAAAFRRLRRLPPSRFLRVLTPTLHLKVSEGRSYDLYLHISLQVECQ